MADRPSTDGGQQHASYSPPPQHRPSWVERWLGSAAPATTGSERAGPPPAVLRPPAAPLVRRHRRVGGLLRRVRRRRRARLGGHVCAAPGIRASWTGGSLISEPVGATAGMGAQIDPDIVRVVEENAVIAAVDEVSPAVVTITPRGRDGAFVFESVGFRRHLRSRWLGGDQPPRGLQRRDADRAAG